MLVFMKSYSLLLFVIPRPLLPLLVMQRYGIGTNYKVFDT